MDKFPLQLLVQEYVLHVLDLHRYQLVPFEQKLLIAQVIVVKDPWELLSQFVNLPEMFDDLYRQLIIITLALSTYLLWELSHLLGQVNENLQSLHYLSVVILGILIWTSHQLLTVLSLFYDRGDKVVHNILYIWNVE